VYGVCNATRAISAEPLYFVEYVVALPTTLLCIKKINLMHAKVAEGFILFLPSAIIKNPRKNMKLVHFGLKIKI
jgi:hypothetical protein